MNHILLELDAASEILQRLRVSGQEFLVKIEPGPTATGGKPRSRYTVTVEHMGICLKYLGGFPLNWVTHFEEDLRRGAFGSQYCGKL